MGYVHVVFPERREVFVGDDTRATKRSPETRGRLQSFVDLRNLLRDPTK